MLRRFPLIFAAVLLLTPPAGAQTRETARARLVAFSGWTAPDRPLALSVEVTNASATPLEDVKVRLEIRERVHSRSALRASLDGNPSGEPFVVTTEQLDQPIAPGAKATVQVSRDLGSLATAFRSGRAINGVYPLGIVVLAAGQPIAELPSAFVFLASLPQAPLNLVWVMPIHRPLGADARSIYSRSTLQHELLSAGPTRAFTDLLSTHTNAPLTLAPTGAFADQMLDLSNGFRERDDAGVKNVPANDPLAAAANELLERLKAAIAAPTFEVATATYGRASLAALVSGGLASDAARQVAVGRDRVEAVLGRAPNPSLVVDGLDRPDARSAHAFAELGAKTLIIDPAMLRNPVEARFGPDRVVDIRSSNLSFDGLVSDAPIADRLEIASQDPVLTAMGIVAETAAAYFELPALATGRLLVMATATTPQPSVVSPLIDVIAQAPWLRLRTATDAAADPALRPTDEPQRLNVLPAADSVRFAQARAARRFVETLGHVVVPPDGAEEIGVLDRTILISESSDYDPHPATGALLARTVRERAQRRLDQISVPARRVTLTSRGGQVPVTVVNATGYKIRLRVRLDSQKVTFPTGSVRPITVPGRNRGASFGTLAFAVEARAAGSFPVGVRLESRQGEIIGIGQIQVSSSAVSAVTFMATAGGALFLAVAWARRAISRRAKRNATA